MRVLPNNSPWRNATIETGKTDEKSHQDVRINVLAQGVRPIRVELTTEEALALCNEVADLLES